MPRLRDNTCVEAYAVRQDSGSFSYASAFFAAGGAAFSGVPKEMGTYYNCGDISGGIYNKDDFYVSCG